MARRFGTLVLTPKEAYVALVLASVLWGSLYTAGKPAVAATGPLQVTLCRVVLACACLGPLVLMRNGGRGVLAKQFRSHWRAIATLGVLNFGISQMLALGALEFIPASVNSVLNNTHPLWVAAGTAIWFPPRRPVWLVGGSIVALIGVIIVFLPDLLSSAAVGLSATTGIGIALSLAGSGVIAIGTVLGRRVIPDSDPMAVTALASGFASIPMLLLNVGTGGIGAIFAAPAEIKLLLLYLGVGCTAANFVLWYYGLKHVSAAPASAFQYVIAPVGVALASIFLREPITLTLFIGTALVLLGLSATQLASRR
jgi:drug/metabolite transporter (DMT)-like permease